MGLARPGAPREGVLLTHASRNEIELTLRPTQRQKHHCSGLKAQCIHRYLRSLRAQDGAEVTAQDMEILGLGRDRSFTTSLATGRALLWAFGRRVPGSPLLGLPTQQNKTGLTHLTGPFWA